MGKKRPFSVFMSDRRRRLIRTNKTKKPLWRCWNYFFSFYQHVISWYTTPVVLLVKLFRESLITKLLIKTEKSLNNFPFQEKLVN